MMSLVGVGPPECTTRDGWWMDRNNTTLVVSSLKFIPKLTNVVNSEVDVFHTYSLTNNSLALNYILTIKHLHLTNLVLVMYGPPPAFLTPFCLLGGFNIFLI
jgi:hypothetical protein